MSMNALPLPRPLLTAIAGLAALALLGALLYTVFGSGGNHSLDDSLKRSADRLAPVLRLGGTGYDSEPTFYRMYQRFVYDERSALVQRAVHKLPKSHWAQIIVLETRSTPPQNVVLNIPGHPPVPVLGGGVADALQKHQSSFATATVNGSRVRVYLTPISPPSVFNAQDVSAVLEVFARQ